MYYIIDVIKNNKDKIPVAATALLFFSSTSKAVFCKIFSTFRGCFDIFEKSAVAENISVIPN